MPLFDVHAHLTHPDLITRVDDLVGRAREAGVGTIISNGLNPSDNQRVLQLSRAYPLIRPALGLYPVDAVLREMRESGFEYADQRETFEPDAAIDWVAAHIDEAFAVGEIGLDGYWVPEPLWPAQEAIFERLVRLAMAADKPIIIHTRKREARALELLTQLGAQRVNWHCFGGRVKLARRIAEHGHFLSIPANARRNEAFTRMLQTLPRDQILLETDCPYLAPQRDTVNEPANVQHTARYAAQLWGTSEGEAERQLSDNFASLFGVEP